MVKVVAFTGAFADAGEYGVAAVGLRDVVDEFENDNGLADAGTTERTSLSSFDKRTDEVDDLNAGFENLSLGVLIG